MFKKRLTSLALVATLGFSFSACEDSTSIDTDGGGTSGAENASSLSPLVNFTCEASSVFEGKTFTDKMGAEGNIACSVESDADGEYVEATFAEGVNEMSITQAIIVSSFNAATTNGTTSINLENGTEHLVGTDSKNGSIDCINTYDIPLPISIYDAYDIIYFELSNYQQIATTCPDWINEEAEDTGPQNFTYLINSTITEDSGDITKLSIQTSAK